jgi:REP element-mobilizing transposase RayT
MEFDPAIHDRRSIRWRGYDYSSRGLYFVTTCTQGREQFLGTIEKSKSRPSEAGKAVLHTWYALPERFPQVELNAFVVMPNHIHGIMAFVGTGLPAGGPFIRGAASSAPTLGKILRAFKSISAIEVNKILGRKGVSVWQRNYYERVIRNARELEATQRYILENPLRWEFDPENPKAKTPDSRMPWELQDNEVGHPAR